MPGTCIIGRMLSALAGITAVGMLCGHAAAFAQSEGSIDASWNPPGQPYLDLGINKWVSIATQPDGKVVVQGQEYVDRRIVFFLRRFNRDGSLDTSFGSGGRTSLDFQSMGLPNLIIDALGRIYIDGENTTSHVIDGVRMVQREVLIARYSANGALDGSFGSGGLSRLPDFEFGTVQQIALQPDGKVLVIDNAGTLEQDGRGIRITRLHPDGRRDSSFGSNGAVAVLPPPSATGIFTAGLKVLSDGSFLVPVTASDATTYLSSSIYKWTAQGAADTGFGINGVADIPGKVRVHDMEVQQDGRILIGGEYDDTAGRLGIVGVVVRFTAVGTQDAEFGRQGFTVILGSVVAHIELERSGRTLAGVNIGGNWRVFQLLGNGELANDFAHTLIPDYGYPEDTIERPSSPAAIMDMALGDGLFLLTSNVEASGRQSTYHIEKLVLEAAPNRGSLSTGQTPSLSGFLVDMRNLGGAPVDTAASSHAVGVDGYIFPQNTDIGSSADIFVVAQTPNGMYMRTMAGYFVRWSNRLADLVPAYENVPLTAPKVHVPIYGGRLPYMGPYLLYIGYMRTDGGPLIYMKEPMSFHILP